MSRSPALSAATGAATVALRAGEAVAQLNIGRLVADPDDPRVAEFMDNIALVNGLAERSAGYLWRFTDEGGVGATGAPVEASDPRMIANLSVWESVEALEAFVWRTVHKRFFERKGSWFERLEEPHFVMWAVPRDHRPTIAEALNRLERLKRGGPSREAFDWRAAAAARLWREAARG